MGGHQYAHACTHTAPTLRLPTHTPTLTLLSKRLCSQPSGVQTRKQPTVSTPCRKLKQKSKIGTNLSARAWLLTQESRAGRFPPIQEFCFNSLQRVGSCDSFRNPGLSHQSGMYGHPRVMSKQGYKLQCFQELPGTQAQCMHSSIPNVMQTDSISWWRAGRLWACLLPISGRVANRMSSGTMTGHFLHGNFPNYYKL